VAVILVVALFFTFGCVLASLARLFYIVVATPIDPSSLSASLRSERDGHGARGDPALGVGA
jgi:hypothetical protein